MTTTKKLIEVALPLDAINKASAREKSIRHGHPSTLHLWWARRPLAAARAVIFAQMVDDPSSYQPDETKAERERQRLFAILEDLVLWENTTNEAVLQRARDAIRESWRRTCAANADHPRARELFNPEKLPSFHDPFAGGGALPLEAQRLGLESYASDLNPVAVLINKAMIEIPPRFAGQPPVTPTPAKNTCPARYTWERGRPARPRTPTKAGTAAATCLTSTNPAWSSPSPSACSTPFPLRSSPTGSANWPSPAMSRLTTPAAPNSASASNATPTRDTARAGWAMSASPSTSRTRCSISMASAIACWRGSSCPITSTYWSKRSRVSPCRRRSFVEIVYRQAGEPDAATNRRVLDAGLFRPLCPGRAAPCGRDELHRAEPREGGSGAVGGGLAVGQCVGKGSGRTPALPGFWKGAQGLAEDVRYYGQWMRDEAEKRIGWLYPKVAVTAEMAQERPDLKPYVGRELTVIAWLWARTVKSPNPAFANLDVPLASTFMLSTKKGKEAYVEPVIENGGYRFRVKVGEPEHVEAAKAGTKLARGANFRCVMSGSPMGGVYIKAEGMAGRMGARLMAIVAEGDRGRVYLEPTPEHESVACQAQPTWEPEVAIPPDRRSMFTPLYGLTHFNHLFTPRQLVALTTFSDLVAEAQERVKNDYLGARASRPRRGQDALDMECETTSLPGSAIVDEDERPLRDGGAGAKAYAEAVGVYLAFAVDKASDYWNTIATWMPRGTVGHAFSKQAIPMTWDYPEAEPLGTFHCAWTEAIGWVGKSSNGCPKMAGEMHDNPTRQNARYRLRR